MPHNDNAWHLDKKVPLGIIAAIIIQTITLVYVGATWIAVVDGRLDQLEKVDGSRDNHETRIVVLEQKFNFIESSLLRIEKALDQFGPKQGSNPE